MELATRGVVCVDGCIGGDSIAVSDFQTADIAELLDDKEGDKLSDDEKAYQALLSNDAALMNVFDTKRDKFAWPEPVRKRFIR